MQELAQRRKKTAQKESVSSSIEDSRISESDADQPRSILKSKSSGEYSLRCVGVKFCHARCQFDCIRACLLPGAQWSRGAAAWGVCTIVMLH